MKYVETSNSTLHQISQLPSYFQESLHILVVSAFHQNQYPFSREYVTSLESAF